MDGRKSRQTEWKGWNVDGKDRKRKESRDGGGGKRALGIGEEERYRERMVVSCADERING